jgi:type I restriction enzyme S subunit
VSIRLAQIGDLVEPVKTWNPSTAPNEVFNYIELSAIDQTDKSITGANPMRGSEAPSRARQLIREGDVLVSTVRPNLNSVAAVTKEFDGATASTGFCVLRPSKKRLANNYLAHWVRSPQFIDLMVREATGASYPAVSDRIVKSSSIPLPSLDEQRRIAAILDKADALRRNRKRALDLLDSLTQSIFLEMFGSESSGFEPLERISLADAVQEFRYGTSNKSGEKGYPVLRIPNVIGGQIDLSDLKTVLLEAKEYNRLSMQDGDLLLVRTNGNPDYVGRCAVVDREIEIKSRFSLNEFVFASYLIRARLKHGCLNPYFAQTFLSSPSGRKSLLERARTSAGQYNINTEGLCSIPIPVPPLDLQCQFASRVLKIRRSIESFTAGMNDLNVIFASLQHRAFSGQL